jgi:hypothetical protein
MNDTLVAFGGAVKALGVENGKAKVGGYAILWGGPNQRDAVGDFFTPKTYLGAHDCNGVDSYLHHAQPIKGFEHLANRRFSPVKAHRDNLGVFAEIILDMHDEYEHKIYELVRRGVLGYSTGAASHLVKKLPNGEITDWIVAELSLTPEPCEPRLNGGIVPLKSLAGTWLKVTGAAAKTMTTTGAGADLVPNPASPKQEIKVSRNTKADGEVCENQDCPNYGQSHANCQCHKTIKGDGSETDYEVQDQDETAEGYPGSGKSDLVARGTDYAAYESNREEAGANAGKADYGVYESNREEVGVTGGAKADYALYESNREEVGLTTGNDDKDESKKDDGDSGELFGHNIGPVRVSLGLAKSLNETKSYLSSVGLDKALNEAVKYLQAVAAVPGIGETLKAGHKYHMSQLQAMLKAFNAPVIDKPATKKRDEDAELAAEIARLTPAERAYAERELATIKRLRDARLARERVHDHHAARKARAAALRRA